MNKQETAKRLARLLSAAIREGSTLISNKKRRERHHLSSSFPQKGQTLLLLWKFPASHTPGLGDPGVRVLGNGTSRQEASQGKAFFLHHLQHFRAKSILRSICRGSCSSPMAMLGREHFVQSFSFFSHFILLASLTPEKRKHSGEARASRFQEKCSNVCPKDVRRFRLETMWVFSSHSKHL